MGLLHDNLFGEVKAIATLTPIFPAICRQYYDGFFIHSYTINITFLIAYNIDIASRFLGRGNGL